MTRYALIALMTLALASSSGPSLAQTAQSGTPPAAQTRSDDTGTPIRHGDDARRVDDGAYEEHAHAPPADPPAKDEDLTVGLGRSVDRAPRDIREPFDE